MSRDLEKSNNLGRYIEITFKVLEIIISVGLLIMIITSFSNVLIRYTNYIPGWSETILGGTLMKLTGKNAEIARIGFIYLVYLGSIIAARDNKHLMIDTLLMRVPPMVQKIIYVIIQLIIMVLMGVLAAGAWSIATKNINDFWVATQFPVFMIHIMGVVLGVALIIISIANLFRLFVYKESVVKLFTGGDPEADWEGVNVE
ncbi:MAG: TRAP transporter small permease subunit [Dehalococcoidales bacterium]|nr:TRAP transporter small permease subunit [Dehalococcoidales bacterium]